MNSARTFSQRRLALLLDVILGAVCGLIVFTVLDFASFGVLTSVLTVAIVLAAIGSLHYLFWGREVEVETHAHAPNRPEVQERAPDVFALEVSNEERAEMVQLLEQASADGNTHRATVRRNLLNRIRMFGA